MLGHCAHCGTEIHGSHLLIMAIDFRDDPMSKQQRACSALCARHLAKWSLVTDNIPASTPPDHEILSVRESGRLLGAARRAA